MSGEAEAMKRGRTERETCELNGWDVGTRLVGDEGYGPSTIRITYFTQDGAMLAVNETRGGTEHFWTLGCRDWRPVSPDSVSTISTNELIRGTSERS